MNEALEEALNKLKETFSLEKRSDMKGENYYIGDGIVKWDNFCIQIRNITVTSKSREKKISMTSLIILIIGSFWLLLIPLAFLRFLGTIGILMGALCIWMILRANEKRMFRVTMKMTSGDRFMIEDRREEFIDQILNVIESSMMQDGKSYYITLNSGIIQCSDHGGISSIGDENWYTIFKSQTEYGEEDSDSTHQEKNDTHIIQSDMAEEDWKYIRNFTERAIMNVSQETELTDTLMRLRTAILNQDKVIVEKELRAMGNEQMAEFMNIAQDYQEKKKILEIIKKIVKSNRRS